MNKTILSAFISMLLLLAACASKPEMTAPADPILIGADFPMTGGMSVYGEPFFEGLQLGVEEVNNAGGVSGRQITILLEDNAGKSPDAVNAAQKLIGIDQVHMLLTTIMPMSGAIAPVAENNQKVLLYAAAVDSMAEQNTWVFKDSVDAYYDCALLVQYALGKGMKTFALFGASVEITTKCKEALDEIPAGKGTLVLTELYTSGDTDFRSQLTKIKAKKPDAVFLSAFANDCIQIWKQARELDVKTQYLLPFTRTGCGEDKAMQATLGFDTPIAGLDFVFVESSPEYQRFITGFRSKYGKEPSLPFMAMLSYDWAHYIAEAFEKCPDASDSNCLRAALEKTDYTGALGHITFQSDHTTSRPRKLITYQNGDWAMLA